MRWDIVLFGIVSSGIAYAVLRHHDKYWMTEAIAIMAIPAVLTVALFLATTQIDAEVMKALIGLLGAIMGYIFGLLTPKGEKGGK